MTTFQFSANSESAPGCVSMRSLQLCIEGIGTKIVGGFGPSAMGGQLLISCRHRDFSSSVLRIDGTAFISNKKFSQCLKSFNRFQRQLVDAQWVSKDVAIVCDTLGYIELLSFSDIDSSSPTQFKVLDSPIRDLAVKSCESLIALCGGGSIACLDISTMSKMFNFKQEEVISSINIEAKTIYCSTESGNLLLFDIREKERIKHPVFHIGKSELFASAPINEYCVLIGFGDGQLALTDIRSTNESK
jgi:hypothetical protein